MAGLAQLGKCILKIEATKVTDEKELRDIKRLLMLLLSKSKVSNVDIAYVLGVDESTVRAVLPKIKKRGD